MMAAIATAVVLAGCETTVGTAGHSSSPALKQEATKVSDAGRRPNCAYYLSDNYSYIPRFFKEAKREAQIGEAIKEGSVLFYGQYVEVQKFAVAHDLIENRDKSPITPNWVWSPGAEEQVIAMFGTDDNWWYLIRSHIKNGLPSGTGYGYWTSDQAGMLCGSVVSFDDGRLSTVKGLSDVYQSRPVQFIERPKNGAPPISVSISVINTNGAAGTIEVNVMNAGRALHTSRTNVDLVGGAFSAANVKFTTERKNGQTFLKSVTVPEQTSLWLAVDLRAVK